MKITRLFRILALCTLAASAFLGGAGCANIVPPAGGPRDSLPPRLLKAEPGDSTRQFNGNRFYFTFDEFVEVQNAQQELLVSPLPRIDPVLDWKLNTVTVKWRDSLEPNTTYTIDFGKSIKDVNEGNVVREFTYTFSTGPFIDSLTLRGNVVLAETGKVDTTLIVMLHTLAEDSAVVNQKPRYVTRLDGRGGFLFKNLPPRVYYLYALKDENNTRRYFNDKQLFAFAEGPVVISDTVAPLTLYAYANTTAAASTAPATAPSAFPGRRGRDNATAVDRRLRFTTNLTEGTQDLLGNFIMSFEQPLKIYDSSKVSLRMDTSFTPVEDYSFRPDSTRRNLVLLHPWKENRTYHLILDRDFAEDSTGKKLLKSDTLSFRTRKLDDYGKLRLRVRNLDFSRHPVLQFVLNGKITHSQSMTGPDLEIPLFVPGEYELRVLFDDNLNGRWDPGEFFGVHRQPERVQPIGRTILVRPRWENEFEIAL